MVEDDIPRDLDVSDFKFRPEDERDDDDQEYDSEEVEEARIESFESTMVGMKTAIDRLQSQLHHINDNVEAIEIDLQTMDDDQAGMVLTTECILLEIYRTH